MLNQVFIVNIVHLNQEMLVWGEEMLVEGHPHHREDMRDFGLLERIPSPKREKAVGQSARERPDLHFVAVQVNP